MAGVSNLQNDSFTTHQQSVNQSVKQKLHTSHSTSHSLHSHARDVQRVPRSQTRIRVAKPRVNPGSEPVQPPRLAGVWTVADTQTRHIQPDRVAGEWTAEPPRLLHKEEQRSRKRTPGGSAHVTTNTGVSNNEQARAAPPAEGRMGGEKWPGCVCVNVTADATTGATALLLPAHVNMSRSHRNAAHARTARRLTLPRPRVVCIVWRSSSRRAFIYR